MSFVGIPMSSIGILALELALALQGEVGRASSRAPSLSLLKSEIIRKRWFRYNKSVTDVRTAPCPLWSPASCRLTQSVSAGFIRMRRLRRSRELIRGRELDHRFRFPWNFLLIDNEGAREQLDLVAKKIKRHDSRKNREILIKNSSEQHFIERPIKGDPFRKVCCIHFLTRKQDFD